MHQVNHEPWMPTTNRNISKCLQVNNVIFLPFFKNVSVPRQCASCFFLAVTGIRWSVSPSIHRAVYDRDITFGTMTYPQKKNPKPECLKLKASTFYFTGMQKDPLKTAMPQTFSMTEQWQATQGVLERGDLNISDVVPKIEFPPCCLVEGTYSTYMIVNSQAEPP